MCRLQHRADTPTVHYSIHTITKLVHTTDTNSKWSLFSQLVTYYVYNIILLLGCYRCIYNAVIVSVGAASERTIHSRSGQSHLSVGKERPGEGMAHGHQSWCVHVHVWSSFTIWSIYAVLYSSFPGPPSIPQPLMLHAKSGNIKSWGIEGGPGDDVTCTSSTYLLQFCVYEREQVRDGYRGNDIF
jgi:hypothetical protein